jgi:hypothetical protein
MCFNEAIIDIFSYYKKEDLNHLKVAQTWNVNHHFLERDGLDEMVLAWDAVKDIYPPFPSFENYLPPDGKISSTLRAYLAGLMRYARDHSKRPVFCEIH